MKKVLISLFATLFAATALFAQTPQEIIAKMDQETARFDKEGFVMVMDMKISILGTFSSTLYTIGNKNKSITNIKGSTLMTWTDGVTEWVYDGEKNEITIKNATPSDAAESANTLNGITEGYDVKLKKETADAWYFVCTKSKNNSKKDDPKKMDLVVSKITYLPISHSTTVKGVTVTLRDFAIGVNEADLKFDASLYPTAKIIDKR